MKKHNLRSKLIGAFILSLSVQACTNMDYDLSKDIDLTMQVGGDNILFPIGSTEAIKLNKIIKVDESDVLHLNGGEYSLYKSETIAPVYVSIPNIAPINIPSTSNVSNSISNVGSYINETLSISPVTSPIKLSQQNLPSSLIAIKSFELPATRLSKITVNVVVTGVTSGARVTLDNYEIKLPDFIKSNELNSENKYILRNAVIGSGLTREIHINSIDFSNEPGGAINIKDQQITLDKEISAGGEITTSNMNASTVIGNVTIKTTITIDPITISRVQGKVNPNININVNPVTFNLPNFLTDEAVSLDLLDPMIVLTTNNSMDIPIVLNATLQGYKNGVLVSEVPVQGTESNPILIDGNRNTVITLSSSGTAGAADSKKYRVDQLSNLFKKTPNEIRLKINAYADQRANHSIELNKQYPLNISYAIDAPFKFGPNLCIVYNDSIDNFNKDIKDVDIKSMSISTIVENNIPLTLKLEASPMNVNKSSLPLTGIAIEVTGDIQPCDINGNIQKSPITIKLTETEVGAMKKLDGVRLKITAKSTETIYGMPLREDQYIKLTGISGKIIGGIGVNLNK